MTGSRAQNISPPEALHGLQCGRLQAGSSHFSQDLCFGLRSGAVVVDVLMS